MINWQDFVTGLMTGFLGAIVTLLVIAVMMKRGGGK